MKFRQDINFLRAIAVIGVVLYHFRPDWLPGGFAGVDVFFVISGYLMTSILLAALNSETFSFKGFYLARFKRIVPAIVFLLLVLYVSSFIVLDSTERATLQDTMLSSLFFISNIFFWAETDYFAQGDEVNWLLHTWSLSVEWQFYLVYPFFLILITRFIKAENLKWVFLITIFLGFVLNIYLTNNWQSASFYLLPSRLWEFLLGGLAVLCQFKLNIMSRRTLHYIGLILILGSYFFLSSDDAWPGVLAIFSVLGATLFILSAHDSSKVINFKFFQKLGTLSYSIYLWHWPVAVYWQRFGTSDSLFELLIVFIITAVCSILSYTFIETQRYKASIKTSTVITLSLVIVIVITKSIPNKKNPETSLASNVTKDDFLQSYSRDGYFMKEVRELYWPQCDFYENNAKNNSKLNIDTSCTLKTGDGGVFLWGDSHAMALSHGIRSILNKDTPFYQVATSGCSPFLVGGDKAPEKRCHRTNWFAVKKITELKPKLVVLAQRGNHQHLKFENIERFLKSKGVEQVILLGPLPRWVKPLPRVVANEYWENKSRYVLKKSLVKEIFTTDEILRDKYQEGSNLVYVSLLRHLCDEVNGCLAYVPNSNKLLVWDKAHLTPEGSLYIAEQILFEQITKYNL